MKPYCLVKHNFTLYNDQLEIVLRSLELYAYNLHFIVKGASDEYDYKNMLIKDTYNDLLFHIQDYKIGYNASKNSTFEIYRSKKNNYYKKSV